MPINNVNNVEYSLISNHLGEVIIEEPINFEDGNGNIYERDKDSKGFLKTKSNELEYYGTAYDAIISQYAVKGIAEDLLQRKRVKSDDRVDERWKTVSETFLDIGSATFDGERRTVKMKAEQGGIYKQIEAALSDDFDLVSTTSSTGEDIGTLNTVSVPTPAKEIFLRSIAKSEEAFNINVSDPDGLAARTFPFIFDTNSDQDNISNNYSTELSANNGNYADLSIDKQFNTFINNANSFKRIKINGFVNAEAFFLTGDISLDIVRYGGGTDYNFIEKTTFSTISSSGTLNHVFNEFELEINEGESIAIGLLSDTFSGFVDYNLTWDIEITEDSGEFLPITQTRAITELEACDRLVAKILSDSGRVKSDMLSNSERLLTQGFWIRGFPDVVNEGTDEERKIQFTTSLKDFIEHIETTHEPVAWWVEREGNVELFRIEPLKYTQQNFTNIKYQENGAYIQASDVTRTNLKDNFYGKIIIGSEEGGEGYEEVFGLQSVCGKATYSTINPTDVVYEKVSPYALGDIDVELPRRKQFSEFPDEDTKYDSIINVLDCVKLGNTWRLKRWSDTYETAPLNIYGVDSAYNLELTPARLLLKHGFNINVGLYHYPNEKITWISSNCNSSLITKKANEAVLKEDGDIEHSRLESPRVRPKSVDFTLLVDLDLEAQITGSTDGIPNWFGLVAVKTNEGIEYMRLIKADTNKEGKHKLVEAFIS